VVWSKAIRPQAVSGLHMGRKSRLGEGDWNLSLGFCRVRLLMCPLSVRLEQGGALNITKSGTLIFGRSCPMRSTIYGEHCPEHDTPLSNGHNRKSTFVLRSSRCSSLIGSVSSHCRSLGMTPENWKMVRFWPGFQSSGGGPAGSSGGR
jgi:hypothetical protein